MIPTVNKNELMRYLGYKGSDIPQSLNTTIDKCIAESIYICSPAYVFGRFPCKICERGVSITNTDIVFMGNDITSLLRDCDELYLLAVTAGGGADTLIRRKMAENPAAGVIYDSAMSCIAENIAEQVNSIIESECEKSLTMRFSPGYGDLPLDGQKSIIRILDAYKKIGLSTTDSHMLTPTKSVTAIIGVTEKSVKILDKCSMCKNKSSCEYRKSGKKC